MCNINDKKVQMPRPIEQHTTAAWANIEKLKDNQRWQSQVKLK